MPDRFLKGGIEEQPDEFASQDTSEIEINEEKNPSESTGATPSSDQTKKDSPSKT